MKNKKRITSLLVAAGLGLVVIPYMAFAQDGVATKNLDDEYINLEKLSDYTVDATVKLPNITVNTVKITKGEDSIDGLTLSKPGDYKVQLLTDADTYEYNIFGYKRGDANIDGKNSVTDLVASYRRDMHPEVSAKYGADIDGSTVVDETDYSLMRKLLVGNNVVLPEPGDKVDEHIVISAVALNGNKLSLTFTNASKVWEAGEESFIEFTYYAKDNSELGTEKVDVGAMNPSETASCELTLPENTSSIQVTDCDFGYWSILVK